MIIESETELDEPCYDCNGEVQVLKKDCPKCKYERIINTSS